MIDLTADIETLTDRARTHVDLFYAGARLSDDTLITRCILLDISASPVNVDLDGLKALADVERRDSVIIKTGWERYRGIPAYDQCPWIDKKLIELLVSRKVVLMLVDSPGIYGGAAGPEHNGMDKYLADNEAHAVENLVHLYLLNAMKYRLYCFPVYSTTSNAAPCRILAEPLEINPDG
ncbi:MAG: cyclase family protein [Spirochaetota bacterium]